MLAELLVTPLTTIGKVDANVLEAGGKINSCVAAGAEEGKLKRFALHSYAPESARLRSLTVARPDPTLDPLSHGQCVEPS